MDELSDSQRFIAQQLDKLLDAAMEGDFKMVTHYAKLINKQARKDQREERN